MFGKVKYMFFCEMRMLRSFFLLKKNGGNLPSRWFKYISFSFIIACRFAYRSYEFLFYIFSAFGHYFVQMGLYKSLFYTYSVEKPFPAVSFFFCMLCVFNLMSSLETITFNNNNCLHKYQLLCEFVSTFICENIKTAL